MTYQTEAPDYEIEFPTPVCPETAPHAKHRIEGTWRQECPGIDPARPSTAELAAIGRPGTVRASARAGSKAHLAELTRAQLDVLKMAVAAGGTVSQNGSTGVTRPAIRALAAKGYGEAMFDMVRRHLIIGFRINDRGRRAVGQ